MKIIGLTPETINSICSSNASTIKEEPLDEVPAEVTSQVAPQVKEEPIFHEPVAERCANIPRPDRVRKNHSFYSYFLENSKKFVKTFCENYKTFRIF